MNRFHGIHAHTIDRYLVGELLLHFAILFLFFFTIFFVNQILLVAERILRQGAPVWDVARLMTYSLPFIIAQSAPFATLVGFLMCLGRFMTYNEIIIFRASGLSYFQILRPVLLLGLVISALSFFVNDYLLPLGTIRYNALYREILSANPAVELEPHSVRRLDNATLVTGDVDGTSVSDLVLMDKGNDGRMRFITAGESELANARRAGVLLQMSMTDASVLLLDPNDATRFDTLESDRVEFNMFETSFFGGSGGVRPNEMTSYDLGREIRRMRSDEGTDLYTLNIYTLEYNKKFSLPFASFFFALLALPLALMFGKHNGQTIGMVLGIVISFFYWAMMILGQYAASRNGFSGFWSMWIPNLVIFVAGILFFVGMRRQ